MEWIYVTGRSNLRKRYITSIHDGKKPLMQLACYEYMGKLDKLYSKNKNIMGICYDNQRIVYSFPSIHYHVYLIKNEMGFAVIKYTLLLYSLFSP